MPKSQPSPTEVKELMALFNTGRHAEVENRARMLVKQYTNVGPVWQLLGISLHVQGKDSIFAFQKAASLMPGDAGVYNNMGNALHDRGQLDDAVAAYRRAVEIKPDFGMAHNNLGNVLKQLGQLDGAVAAYRRAVEKNPNFAEAHNNMGIAYYELGRFDEAVASYRRALAIKPSYAEAHNNLGNALIVLGQPDNALASYRRALGIDPNYAEAHNNMGIAYYELGRFDDAVASYRRAIEIKPSYAEAHNNLGLALQDLGQLDTAIASYRRAIEIKPNYAEAHNNLGNALREIGQLDNALASHRKALEEKPNYADAYNSMGITYYELGRFDDAVVGYRRALEIKPNFAEAHNNLGNALQNFGQLDDALACYRRALELKPDFLMAQVNLLCILNCSFHTPEFLLNEALKYGQMLEKKVTSRFSAWQCTDRPERLRVGMISGSLRNHSAGYFLEGLLTHIDSARVELIAYPTYHKEDELTSRLRPHFAAWKPLIGKSDEAAARLIHSDGVHVLLDLSGHSPNNRLPIFAWKPAPVQASWLDSFATTGVAEMDYLLTDKVSVPEAHQGSFCEDLWYLPDSRLCFKSPEIDLPVLPLPAIKNGYVTFGCFQNLAKVGDEVLAVWANILIAVPGSRLRWQCKQFCDPTVVKQQIQRLQRLCIDPAQVTMHGAMTRHDYLLTHAEVDVILDTFPYPGGTTTCEALWMGVPTLTLAGESLLARQGASMLTAAGLEEWVATSKEEYLAKAIALTSSKSMLETLRIGLRQQVLASPLFDASRFAQNFEKALWGMWECNQAKKGKQA